MDEILNKKEVWKHVFKYTLDNTKITEKIGFCCCCRTKHDLIVKKLKYTTDNEIRLCYSEFGYAESLIDTILYKNGSIVTIHCNYDFDDDMEM